MNDVRPGGGQHIHHVHVDIEVGRSDLDRSHDLIRSIHIAAVVDRVPVRTARRAATRIFLANERAIEPQITAVYERFGLNARQIEIIARATPKRDYYCQSRRGNRLFELGLGAIALALCASSDKVAHALIDELLRDGARPYFLEAWLHANDLAWAADLVPDLTNVQPSPSDGLAALNPNTSEVSS